MNWAWNALKDALSRFGIGITIPIAWTGYVKPVGKDLNLLLDAIHLPFGRPEYQPVDGQTYCNRYVAEVCEIYGWRAFQDRMANDIVEILMLSGDWSSVPMEKCQELANGGTLIVAGLKDNPHGHVNVICPGRPKSSGRWGIVPSCANVGKTNFVGKGINWAFSNMPTFWAWRSTL